MIEINDLTKAYGEQTVLSHINYLLPDTGLICLFGASGCGKSTLLNLIAGFDRDYTGEITVCGAPLSGMSDEELCDYRRNNIGFVFQDYHLLSGYTVIENILLSSGQDRMSETEYAKKLLEKLRLSNKENQKIENLSGGEKQRVAIARALIHRPVILLADEPTGALDRKTSTELMELLKGIAKDCLVLVITHDVQICAFADQTISIDNGSIIGEGANTPVESGKLLKRCAPVNVSALRLGRKNFQIHLARYTAVALAIALGMLSLLLSLSSGNLLERSIADFKEKNAAYNNGYVSMEDGKDVYSLLKADPRMEQVYYQYRLEDVSLQLEGITETMQEKYPMPKATESMSYGRMPRMGEQEIALSPSLAKKFDPTISKLIGKELILKVREQEYRLKVSGIFNAGYDDFFVSSDIEQACYQGLPPRDAYSVSFDVKSFEEIVPVGEMLKEKGIDCKNASEEAAALQDTFRRVSRLFIAVSIIIFGIGLFLSVILLLKLQSSRYRELGLLSALGFHRRTIRAMLTAETLLLSAMAALMNAVMLGVAYLISLIFDYNLVVPLPQILLSSLGIGITVLIINFVANYKRIHTDPAAALRK